VVETGVLRENHRPPVVCWRDHVLFHYLCFVCVLIVVFNIYCVVFLFCFVCLRLVCPVLPVSLDCPFLIATSGFFNDYFLPKILK
jgi:hypothetical protein